MAETGKKPIIDAPGAIYLEKQHTNSGEDDWSQKEGTHCRQYVREWRERKGWRDWETFVKRNLGFESQTLKLHMRNFTHSRAIDDFAHGRITANCQGCC